MLLLKDLKLKGITYQKELLIIIINVIINGKNFYDSAIDSEKKQYEESRKLTLGQGDDYTTGCLNYV